MAAYDWDTGWTAHVNAASVTNGSTNTSGVIANDGKLATEVAITVAYGATATQGVKVYVARSVNGTYEVVADGPWGFEMPATVSTTHRRTFTVSGAIDDFKIIVTNDSGATVTLDVDYKQAVV